MADEIGLGPDDVLAAVTSITFDIAGLELYGPLVTGGRVVLVGRDEAQDGRRLWKLGTGGGSALSMQYADGHLYLVTTDGSLLCVDAGEAAIESAKAGRVPAAKDVKPAAALPTCTPATAAAVATVASVPEPGVVLECVPEGGRLRVRVVSAGYDPTWNVQFPRSIRRPGARYVVDAVHPAAGGFYRVRGEIRLLV